MNNQLKYKGKFISRSQLDRNKKRIECLKRSRDIRNKVKNTNNDDSESSFPCKGRRIIDVEYLSKNLKCDKCFEYLHFENMEKEEIKGLHSIFYIVCTACSAVNKVESGKSHYWHKKKILHNDTTTKAVLGTIHSGNGCTELNKILASLNIPTVNKATYQRYEREVAIELAAKESCKTAESEEHNLVISKIDESRE